MAAQCSVLNLISNYGCVPRAKHVTRQRLVMMLRLGMKYFTPSMKMKARLLTKTY